MFALATFAASFVCFGLGWMVARTKTHEEALHRMLTEPAPQRPAGYRDPSPPLPIATLEPPSKPKARPFAKNDQVKRRGGRAIMTIMELGLGGEGCFVEWDDDDVRRREWASYSNLVRAK